MTSVCPICGNPLPDLAIKHKDPYDRTECARIAAGCPLPFVASPGHPKKEQT